MRLERNSVKEIIYKCGDDVISHSIDGSYFFDRIEFRKRSRDHFVIIIHLDALNDSVKLKKNVKLVEIEQTDE